MKFAVRLTPETAGDFQRFVDHLHEHGVEDIAARILALKSALEVLKGNPYIGRPTGSFRELIIGTGSHGYVALYEIDAVRTEVRIIAIRHQREGGYHREV